MNTTEKTADKTFVPTNTLQRMSDLQKVLDEMNQAKDVVILKVIAFASISVACMVVSIIAATIAVLAAWMF